MKVPFLDLKLQYESIKEEIDRSIQKVLNETAFAGGPFVRDFEDEFAEFCQTGYAVGVSSGTSALWMSLYGLGIGNGDEVITVPNTFIATAEAITMCGAHPVFIDIDETTFTMNPALLEAAITSRTKAVIPVHLFGQMANMEPIMQIAERYGLYVIEDASQAHGAEYKGRRAGSIGNAGCFSFYPGKNLGAFGEAGAVVTNDMELAEKIRMIRDHGQSQKYHHELIGWNARMDGLQGAILSIKLKYLSKWNDARRENSRRYNSLLSDLDGIVTPWEAYYARHVYHIYAILSENRDELIKNLSGSGIYCGVHYPVPVHLTSAYRHLGLDKGSFPVAEKAADHLVSLPMFAELSKGQIDYVADQIHRLTVKPAAAFNQAHEGVLI